MSPSTREQITLALPHAVEVIRVGTVRPQQPTLVMLHHGLGSVSAWRDLPEHLARATGLPVVAYSRRGYGLSDPVAGEPPWPAEFMHREAREDLPALLRALEIERPILFGSSDGASIALIYAGSELEPAPIGTILLAPHVMVEPVTLTGARQAAADFEAGGLRDSLQRHHHDAEATFRGWNETWLSDGFRDWNIESSLDSLRCPSLVVQGLADPYGSLSQIGPIEERSPRPVESLLIAGCGHAPERERPEEIVDATAAFSAAVTPPQYAAEPERIYHLVPAAELHDGLRDGVYAAAHLDDEGFAHCTWSPATLLAVADDLFGDSDPVVLQIDATAISAPLQLEAPAPLPGSGRHLDLPQRFPHVYGPIELDAIRGAGALERFVGRHVWPRELDSLARTLERIG